MAKWNFMNYELWPYFLGQGQRQHINVFGLPPPRATTSPRIHFRARWVDFVAHTYLHRYACTISLSNNAILAFRLNRAKLTVCRSVSKTMSGSIMLIHTNQIYKVITTMMIWARRPHMMCSICGCRFTIPLSVWGTWWSGWAHSVARPCIPISSLLTHKVYL